MTWKIEFDTDVEKDLKKLGHIAKKRILTYLKEKIMPSDDPRSFGKPLSGDLIKIKAEATPYDLRSTEYFSKRDRQSTKGGLKQKVIGQVQINSK